MTQVHKTARHININPLSVTSITNEKKIQFPFEENYMRRLLYMDHTLIFIFFCYTFVAVNCNNKELV